MRKGNQRSAGLCCFSLLGLTSLAAFFCSVYSYAYCDFVGRQVTLNPIYDKTSAGVEQACEDLGYNTTTGAGISVCSTLLQSHAIGFSYWQGTVPVDRKMCFTYTQLTPFGYTELDLDSKFLASSWMSMIGYIFGGMGCFTIAFANCCRIDQQRLQSTSCTFLMASLFTGLSLLMFKSSACEKGFFAPYFVAPNDLNDQAKIETFNSVVSDVSCSLSTGSNLAIASTILYFLCECMVHASLVPDYASQATYAKDYQEVGPQSGEQEQHVEP
jgi:hypothetical protein